MRGDNMSIFARMLGLSPEGYYEEAERLFSDKRYGEAKLEYEKALELYPSDSDKVGEIKSKIEQCKKELSAMHEEWGDSCVESSLYEKAIDEYQLALELASNDAEKKASLRRKLADTKRNHLRTKSLKEAEPYIQRGEQFFKEDTYNGALVEFRQALNILKFLSSSEEKKEEVKKYLNEVEERITKPYVERGEGLLATELYDEALEEFEKARSLITANEKLMAKLDKLIKSTMQKRGKSEKGEDDDTFKFISKQEWDKALGDYSKLLEKYFQYTYEDLDPYKAYHTNKFEKEFQEAKNV